MSQLAAQDNLNSHAWCVAPRAMRLALEESGVQPGEIDYLNAHATATDFGDAAEIAAIKTVFPAGERPLVSSLTAWATSTGEASPVAYRRESSAALSS
jgi:3-oxoacyl-(acyl-carrier-protein) synthase